MRPSDEIPCEKAVPAFATPIKPGVNVEARQYRASSLTSLFAALAIAAASIPVGAEPAKPIRIIVPQAPGGAADTVARLFGDQLSASQKWSVVVENRTGAGGMIATEAVARGEADSNLLLINAPDMLVSSHARKASFDAIAGLEPVCYLVSSPGILVVNSASPYKTLSDLLNDARANPGRVTVGGAGAATAKHVGVEMLAQASDAKLTYVPFNGGAPALNSLLGSHISSVYTEFAAVAGHLKQGTLRALATTSRSRIAQAPDVPTAAEAGLPNFEVDLWWGAFMPIKSPKPLVAEVGTSFIAAMQTPALKDKLAALGFSPVGLCGSKFGTLLQEQHGNYGRIVRDTKIGAK
ncbi:MAG: tripartite tricarboxylate transporter substrate binding protein [Pseudorhodoplanes sp.]|uniref:tripartite tricarboxylate transporter substrate binding protein n=1 Tax=Pseudorhodoplanes sp. TaxID=1934341 RepID=UPI003D0D0E60